MASSQQQPADTLASSFKHGSSYLNHESYAQPLRTFLFGYPIAHSLAPLLHKTLFEGIGLPWTYELHETQDDSEFLPALRQPDIVGCAVTMPYKVKAMSVVDEVTKEGYAIGAINTVFLRKDSNGATRYVGTNTDCIGVRDAFLNRFPGILADARGKPAMVIGGGGACRAAVEIYMVNRLESEVTAIAHSFKAVGFSGKLVYVSSIEQAAALPTPCLVVGTVPDFPPKEPGEIMARRISEHFLARPEKGYILEMCYHPQPRTEFYNIGDNAGWRMMYGTESMIWQGVAQQILWAEISLEKFDLGKVKKFIAEALEKH